MNIIILCLWAISFHTVVLAESNKTEPEPVRLPPFELALNGSAFVDHTYMLKECFDQIPTYGRFILPVAPFGFGKSTNLDMMRLFFEIAVDPKTGQKVEKKKKTKAYKIFTDPKLRISHEKEFIEQHLGEYPIIRLDFENVIADSYAEMEKIMYQRILGAYNRYAWLYEKLSKENENSNDTVRTLMLADFKKFVSGNITIQDLTYSVRNLAHLLTEHFNHKTMVLIDNYDDPIIYANENNETIRSIHYLIDYMLTTLIKVSPVYVDYMVVTGISVIAFAPRSVYTNNLYALHFLGRHFAVKYYGFTETEAIQLFDKFKLETEERDKIRDNCNGYFSEMKKLNLYIYDPLPVVKYLQTPKPDNEIMLENYWVRTGLIASHMEKFLRMHDLRATLLTLLWRGEARIIFDADVWITDVEMLQQIVQGEYEVYGYVKLFFSYLHENGYLTYRPGRFMHGLPNKEVIGDLRMQLKMYYFTDYNMRFGLTTERLDPIVVLEQTNQTLIDELEEALTTLFEPLSRSLHIGYRFKPEELEFETLIFCAGYPHFIYSNGSIPLKTLDGKALNATADVGILSFDEEIMLLIQVTHLQSVEVALDQIRNLIPAHHPCRVVKYLGINVDKFYRPKVGFAPSVYPPQS